MPIDWLVVGSAFLSGLLGGLHCAAMCGGIATGFQSRGWTEALEANLGRVLGYTLAGALVGGIGYGLLGVFRWPGLAQGLRALVGLVLVLAALRLLGWLHPLPTLGALQGPLGAWLRPLQRRLWPPTTPLRRLAAGAVWGWLPCGLSGMVLTAAWLQADALAGALTLLAFGLGTWPVMLPLTWSGARLTEHLQRGPWRRAGGALVMMAGLLTLAAPWLMHIPALHRGLVALGCASATP